jgi:hypothetical protein
MLFKLLPPAPGGLPRSTKDLYILKKLYEFCSFHIPSLSFRILIFFYNLMAAA